MTQSRMITPRTRPSTEGSAKGELDWVLPTVGEVVEEKPVIRELVLGTVATGSLVPSGVLTVV